VENAENLIVKTATPPHLFAHKQDGTRLSEDRCRGQVCFGFAWFSYCPEIYPPVLIEGRRMAHRRAKVLKVVKLGAE